MKRSFEFQFDASEFSNSLNSKHFNGAMIMFQRVRHFHLMGVRQQLHLVQRYKRGIRDKFVDIPSRHVICVVIVLKHYFFLHESYF